MEVILIVLTGTIMSAFFIAIFIVGFMFGKKYVAKEKDNIDDSNIEAIKDVAEWNIFRGNK